MKRKLVLLCLMLFMIGSTVSATNEWTLTPFKGKLIWNGVELPRDQDMPYLHNNGTVYIPIRSLSETSAGIASYDAGTKSIYFDTFGSSISQVSSAIYKQAANEHVTLRINSDQDIYQSGEPLSIWATLESNSSSTLDLSYTLPLMKFYIEDQDGMTVTAPYAPKPQTRSFKPDEQTIQLWDGSLAYQYARAQSELLEESSPLFRPLHLPPGHYIIGVESQYMIAKNDNANLNADMTEISVSIPIVIE